MRLCSEEGKPGYREWRAIRKRGLVPITRLNGQLVAGCVTVDTKLGSVTVIEFDESGRLVLSARGDRVRAARKFGRVELEFKRREKPGARNYRVVMTDDGQVQLR
ncbi:MAG: hypothetical protein LBE21_10065 [Pseudomonadales bacterium]|jgi:hypothetical protein|nr:hypothetical protein [Pseudomonadales bacterium]